MLTGSVLPSPALRVACDVHRLYRPWIGGCHRTADPVDDRVVATGAGNPHAEDVAELHTWRVGGLEGLGVIQRGRGVDEHDVAAHSVALERPDVRRDQEGRVAVLAGRLHPVRLGGRVVGQLVLEEDIGAALAAPDHLVLLVWLDGQAVGSDVVAGNHEAGGALVQRPPDVVAMVRAPCPHVIDDRVVGVVEQADSRRYGRRLCATDPEEDVLDGVRVGGGASAQPGDADREQHRRVDWAGIDNEAGQLHAGGRGWRTPGPSPRYPGG